MTAGRRDPGDPLRVVTVGGGTGLAAALRGFKHMPWIELTAIITVADDGGSSGRLRRDLGHPPPGDIRNCLVALAPDESALAELFQYRFPEGRSGDLAGHSFGNLFLSALTGMTGSFPEAVRRASVLLASAGRVFPASLEDLHLHGRTVRGEEIAGEWNLGRAAEPLHEVWLEPRHPRAFSPAVRALSQADLIVLGPGSLFTSVLPALLVPRIGQALRASAAPKVYVCNVMTQPGETAGLDAAGHVAALSRHLDAGFATHVVCSTADIDPVELARYRESGAQPVGVDVEAIEAAAGGVRVVLRDDLLDDGRPRHAPVALCEALLELAGEAARWQ
jgi:uncharacterized cofD-like protein